jgi:hypothetical protein
VRLKFKPDGSLLKPPKLVNPPSDPAQKPQAKSVLQAVKACDPLPMPAQYRSFYEQWKTNDHPLRSAGRRPLTLGISREAPTIGPYAVRRCSAAGRNAQIVFSNGAPQQRK